MIEPQANSPLSILDEKAKKIADRTQSVFGGEQTIQWMSVQSNNQEAQILIRVKPSALRKLKYKNILNELRKIDKGDLKTL